MTISFYILMLGFRSERSIKTFVIGRKNRIFYNTPNGARASAIYHSLIVTARENGLIPFEYLAWIFTNAPNLGKPGYATAVEDFLPGSTALPERVFSPKPKDAKPANIDFMMKMVNVYLSGETPRYIFELDFQTEILARYKKMVRENRECTELFYDLLLEDGVDASDGLSDTELNVWSADSIKSLTVF